MLNWALASPCRVFCTSWCIWGPVEMFCPSIIYKLNKVYPLLWVTIIMKRHFNCVLTHNTVIWGNVTHVLNTLYGTTLQEEWPVVVVNPPIFGNSLIHQHHRLYYFVCRIKILLYYVHFTTEVVFFLCNYEWYTWQCMKTCVILKHLIILSLYINFLTQF